MRTIPLLATLLDDLVLPASSATEGSHRTLDYLPGATLLGVAAGRLYGTPGLNAVRLFHSGAVRFGNLYPAIGGKSPCLPVPFSWHVGKGASATCDGQLDVKAIMNLASPDWTPSDLEDVQPEQLREGYFGPSGEHVKKRARFQLKTAIDRAARGRAREGQLFGYEALARGTAFAGSILLDDAVTQDEEASLRNVYDGVVHRMGKSRGSQYGRVRFTIAAHSETKTVPTPNGGRLVLFCASDLALRNADTGTPTCTLEWPDGFGLATAHPVPQLCYVRTRRYAPFNGKRWARDLERQVICKGSVLTWERSEPFTAQELKELQQKLDYGFGDYRQDGLGQLLVNPPFVMGKRFKPLPGQVPEHPAAREVARPDHLVAQYLERAQRRAELERRARVEADRQVSLLREAVGKAGSDAPSKSQWSQLRHCATSAPSLLKLRQLLGLEHGTEGLMNHGVSQKKWAQRAVRSQGRTVTFSDHLAGLVEKHKTEGVGFVAMLLFQIGKAMQRDPEVKS